jgi:uncharacterized membrane protein YhaH (DUF805 family)
VSWLATLLLFLVLRGLMRGVPATVARPDRRPDVTTSRGEVGTFIIAFVIVTVISIVLRVPQVGDIDPSEGRVVLETPHLVSVATAAVLYVIFVTLRRSMSYGETESMRFGRAVTTCLRKFAVFNGRASRTEFWFWRLFEILLVSALTILDAFAFGTAPRAFSGIAILVLFLPGLAVTVRRLHDINMSGWLALASLVPPIGPVALIVMGCLRGTAGENRFGPDPVEPASVAEVFA